ncbi:MAG: hypothetical protein IPJ51_06850 [Saprospiraceae bacterium]|nr:hypothetical protein [Saprospiraceae bacterium]
MKYRVTKSEKIFCPLGNYLTTVLPQPPRIITDRRIVVRFLSNREIFIKKEFINEPDEESDIYELNIEFDNGINHIDHQPFLLQVVVQELDKYILSNPCTFVSTHLPHQVSDCIIIQGGE